MFPYFLYFFKSFGDKYWVRGFRFGRFFGSSRNHPQNIAIDRESLISHFGMIKAKNKTIHILKNQENKKSLNFFAVFWALF